MTCEPAVIEQDIIFTDPVLLGFNPLALPEGDPVRAVFRDVTARTLWLSWRMRHVVAQNFADEVLQLASLVRANSPRTGAELAALVRSRFTGPFTNFRSSLLDAWAEQVIPYLGAEAQPLAWVIHRLEETRP
jgi:hypothetical protein